MVVCINGGKLRDEDFLVQKRQVIVIHYGEIALKGKNRGKFERLLLENIKQKLSADWYEKIERKSTRIIVRLKSNCDENVLSNIASNLKKIFGIKWFSIGYSIEKDINVLEREIFRLAQDHKEKKLKIITKRVDKNFPVTSVEVNMKLGRILEERGYKIDLRDPEKTIYIEILPEEIIVSCERQEGLGGLPIGSSGKLLCLFSGGIDSPVAAWMMMKRGCVVDLLHVHATMDKEFIKNSKIMRLHDILSEYSPKKITLYLVPYDEFYSKIHTRNEFERSEAILFRRFIVRLANELADRYGYDGFITGDSLGQVASQTVENIAAVDAVAKKPIYRPLVAMDKEEIMALAQKIGTYEKSIEHYKDCCSLVASARPKTKTKKEKLDEMEKSINIDEVVGKTLETIETI